METNKETSKIRLTQTVSCAGCAAKLNPVMLRQAVRGLKQRRDPNLIVGFDHADDAGIYLLNKNQALVQTVDFFTPIVDDPIWYGRIAAANALSDVYAMGGKPLTALNIFCFPEERGVPLMKQILQGGVEKMNEAKCTLVGGHSIKDNEMKYGLSVTGLINPKRIFSNDKLKTGQVLVLTKKLGTGIVNTAAKFEDCNPSVLKEAIHSMARLNDIASYEMLKTKATGCTDITGFGFLGHLSEMTRASKKTVKIWAGSIPHFPDVQKLIENEYVTRGDVSNRQYAGTVTFKDVPAWLQSVLFDPQTSGGLLISMPPGDYQGFKRRMLKQKQGCWLVGQVGGHDTKGSITVINAKSSLD